MAISDKWTRSQLRAAVRREIMDSPGNWWTDSEINFSLDAWQNRIQSQYEMVWGSATATLTGSSTITITDLATDVLRVGHVYYNDTKMIERSKDEMEQLEYSWRGFGTATQPVVIYRPTHDTIVFVPSVTSTSTGTVVLEYPRQLTMSADSVTHTLPAWTKYSAANYGAYRAYLRRGSNEDPQKAQRYKLLFQQQLQRFGTRLRNHFPKRSRSLRPGGKYEAHILDPFGHYAISIPELSAVAVNFEDEVPGGAINGSNVTFTLTENPNPDDSLQLYLDGLRLLQGTDYTISGTTITMSFAPATGQSLFAHYRWSS